MSVRYLIVLVTMFAGFTVASAVENNGKPATKPAEDQQDKVTVFIDGKVIQADGQGQWQGKVGDKHLQIEVKDADPSNVRPKPAEPALEPKPLTVQPKPTEPALEPKPLAKVPDKLKAHEELMKRCIDFQKQNQKQIEELVGMLGDEDAAVRDAATEMLKRIGPLAVGPVKAAANSSIPEQAGRAKEILKTLQQP